MTEEKLVEHSDARWETDKNVHCRVYSGLCRKCGIDFFTFWRLRKYCSRSCFGADHKRESSSNWNGGKYSASNGYVYVRIADYTGGYKSGLVLEHRYVMEKHLGRQLLSNENIHHKNGDRSDNRIENLEMWVKPQPQGQRLFDKIHDAAKLSLLYPKEFESAVSLLSAKEPVCP